MSDTTEMVRLIRHAADRLDEELPATAAASKETAS